MSGAGLQKIERVMAIIEPGAEDQPVIDRLVYLAKSLDFEVKLVCCDYTQYLVEGYYFSEGGQGAIERHCHSYQE